MGIHVPEKGPGLEKGEIDERVNVKEACIEKAYRREVGEDFVGKVGRKMAKGRKG